jgi:glycosyltransferase involved in cell wall biosynthesis
MVGEMAVSRDTLRVLIMADSRSFHTERYAAELQQQGCQVMTASLEDGSIDHHLLRRRGPWKALHYPLAVREVYGLIDSFKPDVVNAHFASGYGFLAALAVRHRKRPLLLHLWGSDILIAPHKSFLHRRKTRLALKTADFVVGDSNYLLSEADKIGHIQNRRTIVWGIERKALQFRRQDMVFSRPLKILVPRPHETVYDNDFIIRALAVLVKNGDVELTFPAFGSLVSQFRERTANLAGNGPKFYEKMTRPDYLRFAAQHDVYLSAARSDSSPASLLEAMALGLIPVVGDIPGVREWLTSESGYLFDLANERSLHDVIAGLSGSAPNHEHIRQHNLKCVQEDAIFENNIAETIAIMRDLAMGGRA